MGRSIMGEETQQVPESCKAKESGTSAERIAT